MGEDGQRNLEAQRLVIAVTTIMSGGLGSYALGLSQAFASRGWDVHFLVTNERGNLFEDACRAFRVHDLSDQRLSLRKVKQAATLVNRIAPTVLLLNHCSLMHYALPLLERDIRPIVVVHSDDHRFYMTAAMFARWIFCWVVPTSKLARRLSGYVGRFQQHRIRLVPHGVDANMYMRPRSLTHRGPVMTFVGFLDTNKGVDLLPEIMRVVTTAVPGIMLHIIGDGPLRAQLECDFRQRGLLKQTSFMGYKHVNDVADTLKRTDVLIHPTRIEGFGLIIIEAMAAGVVPVVTRLQGITDDIIEDGVNGFLVEPDDVAGFANRISELFLDSEKRSRMADAATERVDRYFSEEEMVRRYAQIFDEPDDRKKPRGPIGIVRWLLEVFTERIAARMKS